MTDWNVDGLGFLYDEIMEQRDAAEEVARNHAKKEEYNFAAQKGNHAYSLTHVMNWICKIDREIEEYREIERIRKESEIQSKKCEKCMKS